MSHVIKHIQDDKKNTTAEVAAKLIKNDINAVH